MEKVFLYHYDYYCENEKGDDNWKHFFRKLWRSLVEPVRSFSLAGIILFQGRRRFSAFLCFYQPTMFLSGSISSSTGRTLANVLSDSSSSDDSLQTAAGAMERLQLLHEGDLARLGLASYLLHDTITPRDPRGEKPRVYATVEDRRPRLRKYYYPNISQF